MKISSSLPFALLLLLAGCSSHGSQEQGATIEKQRIEKESIEKEDPKMVGTKVVNLPEDTKLLQNLFALHAKDQETPISELMVEVGSFFTGTQYQAHTLEGETEELVVNLREFDCTSFVESCLAISRSIKSGDPDFELFVSELIKIRYHSGEVNGYTSRIHYFSDWIHTNNQKQIVKDVSVEIGGIPFPGLVNFMSTHPGSYRQLKADTSLIGIIAQQEEEISSREMYYIPETRLKDVEPFLKEGDIVGLTTGIGGLDISHVGILVRESDRIHLMHASSRAKKVIISEETLEEYLKNNKSVTGIMVARPL